MSLTAVAEASNPYAHLQSSRLTELALYHSQPWLHPVFISDVFNNLHKSAGAEVIQVPMNIQSLEGFNKWLQSKAKD